MKLKKILLWLTGVLLAAGVLVGALILGAWRMTQNTNMPQPVVTLCGTTLERTGYHWQQPVLFGIAYKPFDAAQLATAQVHCTGVTAALEVPEGYGATVALAQEGKTIFDGTAAEFAAHRFTANGAYTFTLTLTQEKGRGQAFGNFTYSCRLEVALEPQWKINPLSASQGDIIALRVYGLPDGVQPTGSCALGPVHFAPIEGGWAAFVPVNYNREPGRYTITLEAGGQAYDTQVEVVDRRFEVQHMTIDQDTYDNTAGSAAASAEYRQQIWPLYDTAGPALLFEGRFLQPVQGEISTEYGLYRYVNGQFSERHAGIDFAVAQGTPIACPAAGQVVFAGSLQLSGYTIVVEHGGGLKSYFFHMRDILVEKGQMVERGQLIGEVGATGYATGPHLHYEVKIGNQSISPWPLFDGTSTIFRLKENM